MDNTTEGLTVPPTKGDGDSDDGIFWPGLGVIIFSYGLILVVGAFASYRNKSWKATSEDMIIAGRDIGLVTGIFTMTATWVGGGYINGTAEYIATPGYGLIWCQAPFAYSLSIFIGGLFYAKKMRNARYATILDPFHDKYGAVMATFLYIPALFGDVFYMGAILSALGATMQVLVKLSRTWSIIISTAISVLYTLAGGLYSVAFTDIVQLCFVFFGLWLVVPFAMTNDAVTSIKDTATSDGVGGPGWLGSLDSDHKVVLYYVDTALLLLLGGIPWQSYYQRVLSQRSATRAQILSLVASFCIIFVTIPAMLIGALAASTNWDETDYDGPRDDYSIALPLVMRYLTPTPVAVIGLCAVTAAVMSSTDSNILSSSSMFAWNVYRPLRNKISGEKTPDSEVLWVIRGAVFVVGGAACAVAILVDSIYGLFYLCSDLIYALMFPQLTCILYMEWTNLYGAVTGYALAFFFRFAGGESLLDFPPLIKYPWYDEEAEMQYFPFKTMSMLLSFIGILLGSWISRLLFMKGILPPGADIFGCFRENKAVELPKKDEQSSETHM